MLARRTYNTNWTGLCNRLEALVIAFALRERFGHEICVDWPELDAMRIVGTRRAGRGIAGRLFSFKLRDQDAERFYWVGSHRHIVIRGIYAAPDQSLRKALPEAAASVRALSHIAQHVREIFAKRPGPVVGVHLRRGDYGPASAEQYDVRTIKCMALPEWLLEHAMEQVSRAHPGTRFFLSYTGGTEALPAFLKRFDWFDVGLASPYDRPLQSGHGSAMHPVADLFALACCPLVIATPRSSFSHWAANILGPPAATILPLPGTRREDPQLGICRLGMVRLPVWSDAGRDGKGVTPLLGPADLPAPTPARTEWLED